MTNPLITTKDPTKIPLLAKISLILFGIFLSSLILSLSIKLFREAGIWLGFVICLALSFLGFHYTEKSSRLRLITWSLTCTLILVTTFSVIGLQILKHNLENVVK